MILDDHIKGCVKSSLEGKNGEESVDELLNVIQRFVKP